MAIPATAVLWAETTDPSDVLDFTISCASLLEQQDETITSYTVTPGPESVLLGLSIKDVSLSGSTIKMWLYVEASKVSDPLYATGVLLPIEVSLTTSTGRKWQRTAVVKVAQK